ncbi:MAG: phage tail protein [Deltaproteobacteria bacterium HGW-Deltaproteobacteria-8]|nr:MAG: phage tail protein [Deltaproteobacteria bacterium HGW-Deltaproteobacteria-8]
MPFETPDQAAIAAGILRDISNQLPEAATGVDSDFEVWIARQTFPDTADTDMLEKHASLRGLTRKRATTAMGVARLYGTPGAAVPLGTEAKTVSGQALTTSEAGTIGPDGTAQIPVLASAAGASGNVDSGVALTLTSAPSGVLSQAVVALALVGGTVAETDAGLLARLLDVLQNPPAGGNKADWRRWAMDVDGVTAAYVFPLRRGIGTVDVCVTSGGGLPSAEILEAARLHLDEERPTAVRNFAVFGPELLPVPVHALVRLSGLTLEQAQPLVEAALNAYFATLEPGDLVYLSRIETAISGVSGVVDRQVTAPAANVGITATQWARLGVVTLEVMP